MKSTTIEPIFSARNDQEPPKARVPPNLKKPVKNRNDRLSKFINIFGISDYPSRYPSSHFNSCFKDKESSDLILRGLTEYSRGLLPHTPESDTTNSLSDAAHVFCLSQGKDLIKLLKWYPPIEDYYPCSESCSCVRHLLDVNRIEKPTLPNEIVNPPPVDFSHLSYDQMTDRIICLDKNAIYLNNFEVNSLLKMEGSITDGATFEQRCAHGLQKSISEMIKLRGCSFRESLLISLLSYHCSPCVHSYNSDHFCFQYSSSYKIIYQLLTLYDDIAFQILSEGVTFNYNYRISSQYIWILYQMMEQMLHTGDETYSDEIESYLTDCWLNRSKISIFGQMFRNRSIYEDLSEVILNNANLIRFTEYGQVLDINRERNLRSRKQWGNLVEKCDDGPKTKQLLLDSLQQSKLYTDETSRWFSVTLKMFYGAMLYVTGPVSLALEQSAQGRPGFGQIRSTPHEEIYINNSWIPISFHFHNDYVQNWYDTMHQLANEAPMDLENLESRFFEAQTTNSAGNTDETMRELRREIKERIPGNEGDVISKVRGVRVIDTIHFIVNDAQDIGSVIESMRVESKAGKRIQQQRRPRTIQMVGTGPQLPGYLIALGLDQTGKHIGFTMSGKNQNDVRDMRLVRNLSSIKGISNSIDIVSMDASTSQVHVAASIAVCYKIYSPEKIGFPKLFLGSTYGGRNSHWVKYRSFNPDGSIKQKVTDKEINLPQLFLMLCAMEFHAKTRFTDGYFQKYVNTSSVVFRSGWFPTSNQHTTLGSTVLYTLYRDLQTGWRQSYSNMNNYEYLPIYARLCELRGGILGDDITLSAYVHGVSDEEVLTKITSEISQDMEWRMNQLGFECESIESEVKASLLKQNGVLGAPELEPGRLVCHSSERGDSVGSLPQTRFSVMAAMHGEQVGRSRNPFFWTCVQILTQFACGYYTLKAYENGMIAFKSRSKNTRVETSQIDFASIKNIFETQKKCGKISPLICEIWKDRKNMYTICIRLRCLWACSSHLGCPFPQAISITGEMHSSSSCFTLPTTAMTKHWLDLASKRVNNSDSRNSSWTTAISTVASTTHMDRDLIKNYFNGLGFGLDLKLDVDYDMKFLWQSGFFIGLSIREIFRDVTVERKKIQHAVLDEWKLSADSLLNPLKSGRSREAQFELSKLRIDVSDEIVYHHIGSTKVLKALSEVRQSGGEFGVVSSKMIDKVSEYMWNEENIPWMKYRDEILSGEIHFIKTSQKCESLGPDIIASGFGHCVPPNSPLSYIIKQCGLPRYTYSNADAFAATVLDERKLGGDPTLYAKLYAECARKGDTALHFLRIALGFSESQFKALRDFASANMAMSGVVKFAINPRRMFFVGVDSIVRDNIFFSVVAPGKVGRLHRLIGLGYAFMFPKQIIIGQDRYLAVGSIRSVGGFSRR